MGLDPRSVLVKGLHVGVGALWLAAVASFVGHVSWAWWAMLACAMVTLWYLPIGTAAGIVEIGLLMLPAVRALGK